MYTNVKKIFLMACIASMLFVTSCEKETQNNGNGYTIETTITGVPDGVRAFLRVPNEKGQPMPKDTAIVQNGKFTFTGKTEYPQMGFVYVNGAPGNYTFIIENSDIKVEAHKDSLIKAKISGGKHNQEYVNFIKN